jgi:hypothetical protein
VCSQERAFCENSHEVLTKPREKKARPYQVGKESGIRRYQEDSPAQPLLGDGISEVVGRRTTLSWLYRRPSDPVKIVAKGPRPRRTLGPVVVLVVEPEGFAQYLVNLV